MNQLERHNLAQIEALNQRGDRMLSVVDLLLAGTMNLEMAALLCALVGRGASFLSGAVPGGAGKTSVMAALLAFLPPGVEIITVDSERALADAAPANERGTRRCYLAHEIGAGGWYGYIWGRAVRDYLNLARRGHMIATGLHADNLAQLRQILLAPPLEVGEEALAALGSQAGVPVLHWRRRGADRGFGGAFPPSTPARGPMLRCFSAGTVNRIPSAAAAKARKRPSPHRASPTQWTWTRTFPRPNAPR